MLDTIRIKLENILTECTNLDMAKVYVKAIVDKIMAYQDQNKAESDLHATFRLMEQYDTLFRTETKKFLAIPQTNHYDRVYQVQEILTICTLMLSYINRELKRHNLEVTEVRGSASKKNTLRILSESKEQYKSEKMSWGGILKAETAIINARVEELKYNSGSVVDN